MNTANLQHAGVLAALGALIGLLRDKGIADRAEIDAALAAAETALAGAAGRPDLSRANGEAIVFPLRFLRCANAAERPAEAAARFGETASAVGRER